jgi:hypothetical protein
MRKYQIKKKLKLKVVSNVCFKEKTPEELTKDEYHIFFFKQIQLTHFINNNNMINIKRNTVQKSACRSKNGRLN